MQAIFKQYWQFTLYTITKKINGILYFLRRLPVLKKVLSPTLFAQYELKKILTAGYFILSTLFSTLLKFLWLGIFYFLAMVTMTFVQPYTLDFLQFTPVVMALGLLMWGLVTGGLYNINNAAGLVDNNERDYTQQFQVSRRVFLPRSLMMGVLQQLVMYVPALLVYSYLGKNLLYLPAGLAMYAAGPLLGSWCSRGIYQIKGGTPTKWGYTIAVILVSGVVYYVCLLWRPAPTWILVACLLIGSGVAGGSWQLIRQFKKENDYFIYLNAGSLSFQEKLKTANNKDRQFISTGLEMQKELELTSSRDFTNLKGSAYLNALLFDRYHKILQRKLLIRLAFFAIVALLLVIVGLITTGAKSIPQTEIVRMLPLLFFLMYLTSLGKAIVQMVFVNCDVAMLYYPFYRERKTILGGFNYRLLRTAAYNSLISLAIFIDFLVYNIFCRGQLNSQFFLVLALLLIALTALFSFHELFAYYLLQPFTGDMTVVSPMYRILSGALYWVSYMNIQIKVAGMAYVVIVSVACLIYVAVGYLVINLKAPQTFRIKG